MKLNLISKKFTITKLTYLMRLNLRSDLYYYLNENKKNQAKI